MELDTYIDMTLPQIVKLFGNPNSIVVGNINKDYLPTPDEPILSAFFSEEELEEGVKITVARWILDKGKTELLVWLRNIDDEWIVFTSWKSPIRKGNVKF